jgi:glycosyltransferase involved in cell wall biosynthesis
VYTEFLMNTEFARVTIVIPCMNEENYLTNLVTLIDLNISEKFDKSDYEIIIVDDGSTDGTARVANALSNNIWKSHFKIKLIELRQNYGKDAAVILGVENANSESEYIILIDADGEHPVTLIPTMYNEISTDDSIGQIVAYRIGNPKQSLLRRLGNYVYSRLSVRNFDGGLETDYRIIRKYLMNDAALLSGNRVHLQSAILMQNPVTKKVLFDYVQAANKQETLRKSRWSNLRLIDYATLSLLKSGDAILKPLLVIFAFNFSMAGFLILLTVLRSFQTGSRGGTATVLIVLSLYFIMQIFLTFIGLMYLRLILVEIQKKPMRLVKKISDIK